MSDTSTDFIASKYLKKEEPDQYGQRHPVENDILKKDSLLLLEEELAKQSPEARISLDQAEAKCPGLVRSDEHRLAFLRCEQFNTSKAAIRLVNYWDTRIELFGENAFSDLTLKGLLKEDIESLQLGFTHLLAGKDAAGRAIIFVDPTCLDKVISRESLIKATWYMLHAALEEESAQQKGVVFIVYLREAEIRHFDTTFTRMLAGSVKGVLPVRVSALHFCHPPKLLSILFSLVQFLLGEKLTKRIRMHDGETDESVLNALEECGIPRHFIPIELGGKVHLNIKKWITDRSAAEK